MGVGRLLLLCVLWLAGVPGAAAEVGTAKPEMTLSKSNLRAGVAARVPARLMLRDDLARARFVPRETIDLPRPGLAPARSLRPRLRPRGTRAHRIRPGGPEFECLARAIYFEARGEPLHGQIAVAEVVLNRVDSPRFPATICGVVHQGAGSGRGCQFSFVCDGRQRGIREGSAWERARSVARRVLDGTDRRLTDGATYFHEVNVTPRWSERFPRTARIGAHLFYRHPADR
ncbi:MAG: cell wall hydrolase [Gemmobacter sp.]